MENIDKGGRPTKYDKANDRIAYKLCLLGLTNEELATFFEVNIDTIYEWQKVHESFSDAIKKGKQIADAEVAVKLHQRATGYTYDDTDIRVIEGKIVKTKVKKHLPADPTAGIYWLNNRRKINFKARQTDETAPTVIVTTTVSAEEAKDILKSIHDQI